MRLSSFMLTALNEQVTHEFTNEARYRALSSWAERLGLIGCASWLRKQADGEHGHALHVIKYIEDRNERYTPQAIAAPDFVPASFREVFVSVYELEVITTEKLSAIKTQAEASGDHLTCAWLMQPDGLLIEQVEEENIAQTILDRIDIRGGLLPLLPSAPDTPRPAETDGCAVHDLDIWIGAL